MSAARCMDTNSSMTPVSGSATRCTKHAQMNVPELLPWKDRQLKTAPFSLCLILAPLLRFLRSEMGATKQSKLLGVRGGKGGTGQGSQGPTPGNFP